MISIDGSAGEGGGQILRTALTLAMVTGRPFRMHSIRAGRRVPGLGNQHLAAVRAAATVSRAHLEGDRRGSGEVLFRPGPVTPGDYPFATGSAGSVMLVLQTVLLPLLLADAPSRLDLSGGTHNPWAPPFDFVKRVYAPLLTDSGTGLRLTLERCGFYPAGGGRCVAEIQPNRALAQLSLLQRGDIQQIRATALVARLPARIAHEELAAVRKALPEVHLETDVREVDSAGPGNAILVEIRCRYITELFTAYGQKGVPAQQVGARVAGEVRQHLDAGVPVGPYLADQLLLPLALAGGGEYITGDLTAHTRTNMDVISRFLDVMFEVCPEPPGRYRIVCRPQ